MIICAGESLIDMVSFRGEAEYTPHVGGSNFNSSIALGRLGADSYYFGAISNDSYGELVDIPNAALIRETKSLANVIYIEDSNH